MSAILSQILGGREELNMPGFVALKTRWAFFPDGSRRHT